jgi:hypothetical protein
LRKDELYTTKVEAGSKEEIVAVTIDMDEVIAKFDFIAMERRKKLELDTL